MSAEIVYSRITEDGGVACGHCGSEHALLPPDRVEVLNSLWCETCKQASLLRPDEQLAFYRARGMEPVAAAAQTPTLVWNGSAYAVVGQAASPSSSSEPGA